MSRNRTITLKSSDGETFEVDELVALKSQVIKNMIEDDCADNEIPLPNVTSEIVSKVIEYCKKHVEVSKSEDRTATGVDDDLKAWDAEFVKVDQATLFDLFLAAHYLDIKSLLDLTRQAYEDWIKKTSLEKMWKKFNANINAALEEEEEEEEVRRLRNNFFFEEVAYHFRNHRFIRDRRYFRHFFTGRNLLEDIARRCSFFRERLSFRDRLLFEEVARSFQDLLFCRCPDFFEGPDGRFPEYLIFLNPSSLATFRRVLDDLYIAEEEADRLRDHICF